MIMVIAYIMKNILLTGYEKFLNYNVNPTERLALDFDNRVINDYQIHGRVFKLHYYKIREQIVSYIKEIDPEIILLTGQAPRAGISIEKIAINYVHTQNIAYNCGTSITDSKLNNNGPDAYFSTLPIFELIDILRKNNIPSYQSLSAGSYGCNQLFYETMHYLNTKKTNVRYAGFIHYPMLPEQAVNGKMATMDYQLMFKSMNLIIDYLSK